MEEALPVYEQLGDIRSHALTMGKIADIHEARGQFDEALRIRTEQVLPVYEKLKARREILVCEANMAKGLLKRKRPGDQPEAERLLRRALAEAEAMKLPEAAIIQGILSRLSAPSAPR